MRGLEMSLADPGSFHSPLVLAGGGRLAGASRDHFFEFCRRNPDVRMERTGAGDLIISTRAGSESGRKSGEAFYPLTAWSKQDGTGVTFDASMGFGLPKGG
jgi:Uma2 family endonuclease